MSTPDFNKFLEAFNDKALRPALAAGKEKLDQALATLPASFITQSVEDLYAQIENVDVASSLGKIDPATIEQSVDKLKEQLQNPAVSQQLAQGVKIFLDKNSTESLEAALTKASLNASPAQQFAVQMLLAQLSPKLDTLRTASVDEVAAQIRTTASNMSGADIAAQVTFLLQSAPQMLAQQPQDLTSKLPAPQTVADVMQGLGKVVSDTLDSASKGATLADTVSALKQLPANANEVIACVLGQNPSQSPAVEKPVKKAPKKGGKKFDF